MIIVCDLQRLPSSDWKDLERRTARSYIAYQSYEWARAVSKTEGSIFLLVYENDELLGGVRWWERTSPIGRILITNGGPLSLPGSDEVVLRSIATFIKQVKSHYSIIYFAACPPSRCDLQKYGVHRLYPMAQMSVLDLSKSQDTLWNELSRRQRRAINKAQKAGLVVKSVDSWDHWKDFLAMHEKHATEKGFQATGYNFLRNLYDNLYTAGKCKLLACWEGSRMIGGLLTLLSTNTIFDFKLSSEFEFKDKQPTSLLEWESILLAKQAGVRFYNMGGISGQGGPFSGISEYKKAWVAKPSTQDLYAEGFPFRVTYRLVKSLMPIVYPILPPAKDLVLRLNLPL